MQHPLKPAALTEPWASAHGPIWEVSVVSGQLSGSYRYQAFEFFQPVEDDVDLGRLLLLRAVLNHHEPLAIGGYIIRGIGVNSSKKLPFEEGLGTARGKIRLCGYFHNHHFVPVTVE